MDHKAEDVDILNERGKWSDPIGPKKKRIYFEMLSISRYYEDFVPLYVAFLEYFKTEAARMKLPTGKQWKSKKQMETMRSYLRAVFSYRIVRRAWFSLMKQCGIVGMSRKYYERYCKPTDMIEHFLFVYLFNVDGVKKKVEHAVSVTMGQTPLSSISTDSSLTKGGLKAKLKPRFPTLDSLEGSKSTKAKRKSKA